MTGFEVAKGGYQELARIKPDLTAMGKVIGGGLPVGAFGGRSEIMDFLSPDGPVYQAGTLSGNPLAMGAGLAQLRELERVDGWGQLERSVSGWRAVCGAFCSNRQGITNLSDRLDVLPVLHGRAGLEFRGRHEVRSSCLP